MNQNIKILQPPDKENPIVLNANKIKEESRICPYCNQEVGWSHIFEQTRAKSKYRGLKGLFSSECIHEKKLLYHCDSCGAKWETQWFQYT